MKKENNMISMDKNYITKEGEPVRILCIDNDDTSFPVVGSMQQGKKFVTYTRNGYYWEDSRDDHMNLIEIDCEGVTK